MFAYYLCDNYETIYRLEFTLKKEQVDYYLSLLRNYLDELVFVDEVEQKNLAQREDKGEEPEEQIIASGNEILLKRKKYIHVEDIAEHLPLVVTEQTKSYRFLRPYAIRMLIAMLSSVLEKEEIHPYISKIQNVLGFCAFIDFQELYTMFFDDAGCLLLQKYYDYEAISQIFKDAVPVIDNTYSRSSLVAFCGGEEAEYEIAEGIVEKSQANAIVLKQMNLSFSPRN